MSLEKKVRCSVIWLYIRTGMLGLLLTLVFLFCLAFLISQGIFPNEKYTIILPVSVLLSGFCARKLTNGGREEGALIKACLSSLCMMLLFLLLSASIKGANPDLKKTLSTAGAYFAGDMLASAVRINKKPRRKHNQKQKYYRRESRRGR